MPGHTRVRLPRGDGSRDGLAFRYYIKNVNTSESLLPDEVVSDLVKDVRDVSDLVKDVSDLVKDSHVNLLQLNPVEVSTQLKVGRHCREMQNFNSKFAIIAGLSRPRHHLSA